MFRVLTDKIYFNKTNFTKFSELVDKFKIS